MTNEKNIKGYDREDYDQKRCRYCGIILGENDIEEDCYRNPTGRNYDPTIPVPDYNMITEIKTDPSAVEILSLRSRISSLSEQLKEAEELLDTCRSLLVNAAPVFNKTGENLLKDFSETISSFLSKINKP